MAVIPSLRVNGVPLLPSGTDVYVGTGTAEAGLGGGLHVTTTEAATTAVTTEEDLASYTLPAGTLSANGHAVRVTAWVATAANDNAKTIRLYVGGTVVAVYGGSGSALNDQRFEIRAIVIRTGASSQLAWAISGASNTPNTTQATLAADTSAGIVIKVTGQNGAASAGDITFKAMVVESARAGA